ncbi:hypothetical protein BDR07DRAFT_1413036 [Suillus spraguei]|nr:hypothetical protein BDR07DRAFT_1413036 [Suillus spraguei]
MPREISSTICPMLMTACRMMHVAAGNLWKDIQLDQTGNDDRHWSTGARVLLSSIMRAIL